MVIIWGLRIVYRTLAQGEFFCRRCGGDRHYRHRAGRRFCTLFFIPVIPLNKTGQHVQCTTCKTRYVTEVLALPTAAQMQAALPAGVRALICVILLDAKWRRGRGLRHTSPSRAPHRQRNGRTPGRWAALGHPAGLSIG